jgi:hypothetical protein
MFIRRACRGASAAAQRIAVRYWCPGEAARLFFVNKKKQKNFMTALRALELETLPLRPTGVARRIKFFARFFQKSAACLLLSAGW